MSRNVSYLSRIDICFSQINVRNKISRQRHSLCFSCRYMFKVPVLCLPSLVGRLSAKVFSKCLISPHSERRTLISREFSSWARTASLRVLESSRLVPLKKSIEGLKPQYVTKPSASIFKFKFNI